ncbi:MAG: hypothetical protein L6265_11925 [Thermoplasmatales archaeon]|nr:hypothetical protein [Thermoplasmatales archaeon]
MDVSMVSEIVSSFITWIVTPSGALVVVTFALLVVTSRYMTEIRRQTRRPLYQDLRKYLVDREHQAIKSNKIHERTDYEWSLRDIERIVIEDMEDSLEKRAKIGFPYDEYYRKEGKKIDLTNFPPTIVFDEYHLSLLSMFKRTYLKHLIKKYNNQNDELQKWLDTIGKKIYPEANEIVSNYNPQDIPTSHAYPSSVGDIITQYFHALFMEDDYYQKKYGVVAVGNKEDRFKWKNYRENIWPEILKQLNNVKSISAEDVDKVKLLSEKCEENAKNISKYLAKLIAKYSKRYGLIPGSI